MTCWGSTKYPNRMPLGALDVVALAVAVSHSTSNVPGVSPWEMENPALLVNCRRCCLQPKLESVGRGEWTSSTNGITSTKTGTMIEDPSNIGTLLCIGSFLLLDETIFHFCMCGWVKIFLISFVFVAVVVVVVVVVVGVVLVGGCTIVVG